jgi:hypothetical protein
MSKAKQKRPDEIVLEKMQAIFEKETFDVYMLIDYWRRQWPDAEYRPNDQWFRRWIRWYGYDLMVYAIDVTRANLATYLDCIRHAKYASVVARNLRDFALAAEKIQPDAQQDDKRKDGD